MDSIYIIQLRRVFGRLLLENTTPSDDTCLQKLLDSITRFVKAGDFSCFAPIEDFLKAVGSQDVCPDSSIKTFAVHLLGILGGHKHLFVRLQESGGLLDGFCERLCADLPSEDLGVVSAVMISLTSIAGHTPGMQWLLDTRHDMHKFAVEILSNGKSVFVISAAQRFLTELVGRLMPSQCQQPGNKAEITESLSYCSTARVTTIYSEILEELLNLIRCAVCQSPSPWDKSLGNSKGRQLLGCRNALEVIQNLCSDYSLLNVFLESDNLNTICRCFSLKDSAITQVVMAILEICLLKSQAEVSSEVHSGIPNKVNAVVLDLLDKGNIETPLAISQRLFFRCDGEVGRSLEKLALSPLHYVLKESANMDRHQSPYKQLLQTTMEGKTRFTHLLTSLLNTIRLNTKTIKDDLISDVIKLLQGTIGSRMNGPAVSTDHQRHLLDNVKLQKSASELLYKWTADMLESVETVNQDVILSVMTCLLSILEQPQTDVQVMISVFEIWKNILSSEYLLSELGKLDKTPPYSYETNMGDNSATDKGLSGDLLVKLAECVEKKMCDVQWEIRDTAIEFVCRLLEGVKPPGGCMAEKWILGNGLHVSIWQSVKDSESYVRATALRAVSGLVNRDVLWNDLLSHVNLVRLLEAVVRVVKLDSEAFPRRAAVDLLQGIHQGRQLPPDSQQLLYTTMNSAVAQDFDWQVKLKGLTFWDSLINSELEILDTCRTDTSDGIPNYAASLYTETSKIGQKRKSTIMVDQSCDLEKLLGWGCLTTVLTALDDYDQSVCEKACRMLVSLKQRLGSLSSSDSQQPQESKVMRSELSSHPDNGADSTDTSSTIDKLRHADRHVTVLSVEDFLSVLQKMDLEKKLERLSQSSDEYVRKPESLLEDILTAISQQNNEDNAIDCY